MSEQQTTFWMNRQTFEIVPDWDGEENQEQFVEVLGPMDMVDNYSKDEILRCRGNILPTTEEDRERDELALANDIFIELERTEEREPTEGKVVKPPKEKKETKAQMIRRIVEEKGSIGQSELSEMIGSTPGNIHTMVSIIKNPKRTKDPVAIVYDKKEKTYSWPK